MGNEKLKKLIVIVKHSFTSAEVPATSVLVTYYLLLSIFPMLIALGNLLPFFNIDPSYIIFSLDAIVPQALIPFLQPIVVDLLSKPNGGWLSFSAISVLWSSSLSINYLQKGINRAYGLSDASSSVIAKRLVSLITFFIVFLLLVGFILLFSFGDRLLSALFPVFPRAADLLGYIVRLKWPLAFGFMFVLLIIVYLVIPDVKLRAKDVLPGAAFSTTGVLLLVQLYTIYIQFSTQALFSYSTLGGFFVLMFWLHFTAIILILGGIINASFFEYRFGPAKAHVDVFDIAISRTRKTLEGRLKGFWDGRQQKKAAKSNEAAPTKKAPPKDAQKQDDEGAAAKGADLKD